MSRKRFPVFDANSHVVESADIWHTYLEPEYRALGKFSLWREEGEYDAYLKINGEVFRDQTNPNIPRHAIWRPGMSWEQIGELDPDTRHAMTEGASDPQARLRDMDAMGVDQALLYPTWFAECFALFRQQISGLVERLSAENRPHKAHNQGHNQRLYHLEEVGRLMQSLAPRVSHTEIERHAIV